jgi:glycosyltransferase involved in cell wall biosynthesis
MSRGSAAPDRVIVAELVNCLGIGGTERQLVEMLRRLDTTQFAANLYCLKKVGEHLADVRALNLDPTQLPLKGTLLHPNTVRQVVRFAGLLRKSRASLVHAHDFYSNLLVSAAGPLARIPWIISRRDTGAWIDWKRAKLLAALTRRAPYVLCNAYAIRDQLVHEEGVRAERVTVIHNGLDLTSFDRKTREGSASDIPGLQSPGTVVTLVANLKHEVKGHADMLRAASLVVRQLPDCRFLFVGDGELRPALEQQARQLGIANHIIFAGRRTDVPAILARSHIAICASHAEGLSNAVMEGMAARLPVVATGVGGNVELIRDGRTGFIVRRSDATAMAQRIIELARQPELARRFGFAGRRRIEQEFSTARMGAEMNAFYARILGLHREERRAA